MKPFFLIDFLILIFCYSNLAGQITIIGDVKYGDGMKFRYRKAIKVDITSDKDSDIAMMKFYYQELHPVAPSDKKPGTEISFKMPLKLFNEKKKSFYKSIDLKCTFIYPSFGDKQDTSKMGFKVDLSDYFSYNENTIKLNKPILILNAPERFTLTMMISDINGDFNAKEKDSGYQKTVRKLDKHFDDYYNSKKIDYNSLLDFYKLLLYTEYYVSEHSFFSEEADKLFMRISVLKKELYDTAFTKGYQLEEKSELLDEFIISNEVYQEYLKVFGRLKDYYSRLQLILFLKTR